MSTTNEPVYHEVLSPLDYIVDNENGHILKVIVKEATRWIDDGIHTGVTVKTIIPNTGSIGFIELLTLHTQMCISKNERKYRPLNKAERVLYGT